MSWSEIPGWFSFSAIYDRAVAEAVDGDSVVEVGVAFGRSLAYLARKVIDSGKKIRIYAIDPWAADPDGDTWRTKGHAWGGEHAGLAASLGGPFNAFCHMMRTHAPEELERVHVLRCSSRDAFISSPPLHRLVMIDANHSYEAVSEDISMWREEIVAGGILAGDDFSPEFPGVQRAVREAFGNNFMVEGTTWSTRVNHDA